MSRGKAKKNQTYVVAGVQAVLGRANGDQLTSADIGNEVQERRLVESGAITPTEAEAASETQTSSDPAAGANDKE